MTKRRNVPQYKGDLAGFAGILRVQVFSSQQKAADYFGLNRTTIVRYENDSLRPPPGYLAGLARLFIMGKEANTEGDLIDEQQMLLEQINKAIQADYNDIPFKDWAELCRVADAYLEERQSSQQPANNVSQERSLPGPTFFVEACRDWLNDFFRWPDASDHARSSWAGMVLYSLSAVTDRFNPRGWLIILLALILWVVTAWFILPILAWPINDPQLRWIASLKYGLAAILIPLLVAFVAEPDLYPNFRPKTIKQHLRLWLLKFTGALVGFYVFSMLTLVLVMGWYYFYRPPLSLEIGAILALIPLFFSYISARRIPADRYKMFGEPLRLHNADPFFMAVFLVVGPATALFWHYYDWFLTDRRLIFSVLIVFAGVALWEYRKQNRDAVSDPALILILGFLIPISIMPMVYFFMPRMPAFSLSQLSADIIFWIYLLSWTSFAATLLVRNKPIVTLAGIVAVLILLSVTYAIAITDIWLGRGFVFILALGWLLWGRRRFKNYLWFHGSFWIMGIFTLLGIYLLITTAIPLWLNGLSFMTISLILITRAYQQVLNNLLEPLSD